MRLHRFYISESIGLQTEFSVNSAELVNQIRRVFRLKNEDSVIVFDGSGSDYVCRIENSDKDSITFAVVESSRSRSMPETNVVLCAAMVKKDTFEWIAEKATELGISKIIPIIAERSEKKSLNESRLKKIVIEASEQSGRGTIPLIDQSRTLADAVAWISERRIPAIAFHIEGAPFDASEFKHENEKQFEIFIGPEGGWSDDEIALFHTNNIPVRCLGTQVLRAETAVVAALSLTVLGK